MIVFFFESGEESGQSLSKVEESIPHTLLNTSALIFVLMGVFVIVIILYLRYMNQIVSDKAQI